MKRNALRRLPRILGAYAAAMIVSSSIVAIYGLFSSNAGPAESSGIVATAGVGLAMTLMIAIGLTVITSLPAALAVAIAETTKLRTWLYFVGVGMFLGHLEAASFGKYAFGASTREFAPAVPGSLNWMYAIVLTAGAVGGLTYWYIAEWRYVHAQVPQS